MVYSKKNSGILSLIISSALILFYIADGINKFIQIRTAAINLGGDAYTDSFSASIFLRFAYELIFLYLIYRLYDKERGTGVMLLAALFIFFLLGQFVFLLFYNNSNYNLGYHITFFNKYIFLFIIYYGIKDIIHDKKVLAHIASILETIYVINSILIFLGVILQIQLFKSYFTFDYRYGYDGLIASINEATLFYMLGISLLYFRYVNRKKGPWSLLICIAASFLMGAKAMYLFLFLLLIYHLVFKATILQKVLSTLVLVMGIIVALPVLLSDKYSYLYEVFVYQYEKSGFLSMITSGRNETLISKFSENVNQWSFINYLFGGTDQFKYYIEMDFFDAFLFFGIIGLSILMVLYFKTFFKKLTLKSFRLFFCLLYFIIAFMTGHFFSSAMNALYFNIAMLYIYAFESARFEADEHTGKL